MIWSISWRNVWRNKMRSSIVIIAVSLGVFAGVFTLAFMKGLTVQRLNSAIKTETSHIQIHTKEFIDVNDIEYYFKNSSEILKVIDAQENVLASSERIIVNTIISSAEKGGGVKLVGVVPEKEAEVTNIKDKLIEGSYLEPLKRGRPIVIGNKLAEKLDVKLGSKIVAGLLDVNDTPIYYQFRVGGIFQTASGPFDEGVAFVNFSDLQEITRLPSNVAHEIAVYVSGEELSSPIARDLKEIYPELSVMEWFEILPELGYLNESMDFYIYIFIIIILLALGFGIVNTMLMVVLERIKELGMLMAVGMNKLRVFKMIMLETVFLSLTGGLVGILLGTLVSGYYNERGIDLSGLYKEGLSAIGYDAVVFPEIFADMIIIITILVILTGIIASIYPALKALKLNPAEAIRTDN
jgi:putative ABC transport system permease protein